MQTSSTPWRTTKRGHYIAREGGLNIRIPKANKIYKWGFEGKKNKKTTTGSCFKSKIT